MDLNSDGVADLISGEYMPGDIHFFEGVSGGFKPSVRLKETGAKDNDMARAMSTVHATDWDGDSDLDLVLGNVMGGLFLSKNVGSSKEPKFGPREPLTVDGKPMKVKGKSDPFVVDWDGDGKRDILVGDEYAQVTFFKGLGGDSFQPGVALGPTTATPDEGLRKSFPEGKPILPGYRLRVHATDWNNDGKLDLLVGNCVTEGTKTTGHVYVFLRK